MTANKTNTASSTGHRYEIDGLRGWAALVVVLFHLFYETFGILVPEFRDANRQFFLHGPLGVSGPLAVSVFFVLSGDALSAGYLNTLNTQVVDRLVVKRYFRLAIPIFFSCALTFVLMKAGLTFNHAASEIVNRPDWLGIFLPFESSIKSLVEYSFVGVFSSQSNVSYNAFLWTMSIELVGSMFVFFYLYAFPRLRFPGAVLLGLATLCLLFKLHYAGFFIGVYFGRLRVEKFFERAQNNRLASSLTITAPILIIVAVRHFTYDPIVVNTVVASLLVFLVYANKSATRFFSSGLSKLLGRLSFPLYLSQFSVIVSFTSYAIILAHRSNHLDKAHILLIIALSLALIFLVASALTVVDRYTLRFCNLVCHRLLTTTGKSGFPFRGASKSLNG